MQKKLQVMQPERQGSPGARDEFSDFAEMDPLEARLIRIYENQAFQSQSSCVRHNLKSIFHII